MKTKFVIFVLIATLTGCANQIQVQSQSCQELYDTSPKSAITICQNELTQNPNNAELQFYLGYAYDLEADYKKAVEWYTKSANQGFAEAQYNLGAMYVHGQGVKQNYTKALEWFTKSANQDNAKAQYNLGVMYHNGDGVNQNPSTANQWFTKACKNGHQTACLFR